MSLSGESYQENLASIGNNSTLYHSVMGMIHKQMAKSTSSRLVLYTRPGAIVEFRKNGTRNCKYERETEIDRTRRALPFVAASLFPGVYCRTALSPREI